MKSPQWHVVSARSRSWCTVRIPSHQALSSASIAGAPQSCESCSPDREHNISAVRLVRFCSVPTAPLGSSSMLQDRRFSLRKSLLFQFGKWKVHGTVLAAQSKCTRL